MSDEKTASLPPVDDTHGGQPADHAKHFPKSEERPPEGVSLRYIPCIIMGSSARYDAPKLVSGECEDCGHKAEAERLALHFTPEVASINYQCPTCGRVAPLWCGYATVPQIFKAGHNGG